MGVAHRGEIAAALMASGMDVATPVVVMQSVTWPQELSIRTSLGRLGEERVRSPAVIVIGETARLHLKWRESLPLNNVKIHLLRPLDHRDRLASELRHLGATVVCAPAIEVRDPSDGEAELRRAVATIGNYDWLLFTSRNGVERTLQHIPDLRVLTGVKIACIGSGTRQALADYRIGCDLVPPEFVGESLVASFPSGRGRVLFPRARYARDVVRKGLEAKGWSVDIVEAYQVAVPDPSMGPEAAAAMDMTIFTAASTVSGYFEQYPGIMPRRAIAIGPVTADRLRRGGVREVNVAREYSVAGLVEVITELAISSLDN
jgi:uroporphyrinogen III methyltransferase/synthase